jgi:hypothetical protein
VAEGTWSEAWGSLEPEIPLCGDVCPATTAEKPGPGAEIRPIGVIDSVLGAVFIA